MTSPARRRPRRFTVLVIALAILGAVGAALSVREGLVGAPLPGRHSSFEFDYFREHGPGAESAY